MEAGHRIDQMEGGVSVLTVSVGGREVRVYVEAGVRFVHGFSYGGYDTISGLGRGCFSFFSGWFLQAVCRCEACLPAYVKVFFVFLFFWYSEGGAGLVYTYVSAELCLLIY